MRLQYPEFTRGKRFKTSSFAGLLATSPKPGRSYGATQAIWNKIAQDPMDALDDMRSMLRNVFMTVYEPLSPSDEAIEWGLERDYRDIKSDFKGRDWRPDLIGENGKIDATDMAITNFVLVILGWLGFPIAKFGLSAISRLASGFATSRFRYRTGEAFDEIKSLIEDLDFDQVREDNYLHNYLRNSDAEDDIDMLALVKSLVHDDKSYLIDLDRKLSAD